MINNELRAQLLIEAADLLDESAGANGFSRRQFKELLKYKKLTDSDKDVYKYLSKNLDNDYQKARKGDKTANYENSNKSKNAIDGINEFNHFRNGLAKNLSNAGIRPNRKVTNTSLHDKINKRAAIKESIDLLYDKAALCESAEETEYYINQALELSELL